MKQWIQGARLGDQLAWRQIVQHFNGMAFSAAYAKLGDRGQAEDAVQEAFAEAANHLHKLQEAEAFPGWFKIIVERQCYRLIRRKKHATMPLHETADKEDEAFNVELIAERNEWQTMLHQAVEGLSKPLKLAVQLYYFQGYPVHEIASYLSVSPSVLKKRLFDARHKLRSQLLVADFVSMFNDMHEGGESMLHIVNGDHVGDKLREGNICGDILVWREIYPVGPVFLDMSGREQRSDRADYLERTLGIPRQDYIANCKSQEDMLQQFHKYDEVVLWFEHDLFDQLMLSYLLQWFSKQKLGRTKLNLLCIGNYPDIELFKGLGQLSTKQLMKLSGTWQRIGRQELETGKRIWEAYASSDIERHAGILREDTSALPFAHAALDMHVSRLPSATNGLGIVEQTILELAINGLNAPREMFRELGSRLIELGMGDLEFWYRLRTMTEQPDALIEITGPEPSFDNGLVQVTELGRDAAAGVKDWAAHIKPSDERYGGLHLNRDIPWRWDQERKQLVRT
ncbi:sigma-70 family RNA polymerase sigma factor [Paenibacillus silvisoli]|uniref:sigma-70 family RNA polymerase sigma factor n=1 Tax=Paenibacillus silvisoli TaxID=3110539 RepID=UPI0028040F35|nr:sigma-70 family RNA polymerase sigma factor [Paenibacillus silvisoli]